MKDLFKYKLDMQMTHHYDTNKQTFPDSELIRFLAVVVE